MMKSEPHIEFPLKLPAALKASLISKNTKIVIRDFQSMEELVYFFTWVLKTIGFALENYTAFFFFETNRVWNLLYSCISSSYLSNQPIFMEV